MIHLTRRSLLGASAATAISVTAAHGTEPDPDPDLMPYVPTGKPPRRRFWEEGAVLDQWNLDACEMFAMVGAYMSATGVKLSTKQGNRLARKLWNSKPHEGPGYTGFGGVALHRSARELGLCESWTLPQTMDDLIDAVCYHGPISIGVRATHKFTTTVGREVKVGSTRNPWEAHAVVLTAFVPRDYVSGRGPSFRIRNSWGKGWGQNGSAWITVEDLARNIGPRPYVGYYQDMWAVNWIKP